MGCIVHGVTKSQTRLSDFHLLFLEKSQGTVHLVVISQIAVNKLSFLSRESRMAESSNSV